MVRIREALIADAADIARIDIETWRAAYAGILPEKLLVGMAPAQRTRLWTSVLARTPGDVIVATDRRGTVVGFGSCGERRDGPVQFAGEIFTLYVGLDVQGQGIGRQLLLALFTRLARRGRDSAVVWVLRDNPSRFFYERLGAKLASHRKIHVGGAPVEALAYGWSDLPAVIRANQRTSGSVKE
jgi:ribosomal protein S18 acetylase RimI-like enzyme